MAEIKATKKNPLQIRFNKPDLFYFYS